MVDRQLRLRLITQRLGNDTLCALPGVQPGNQERGYHDGEPNADERRPEGQKGEPLIGRDL